MPLVVMITVEVPLPAGRDLLLENPCKVKRFLALAAKWPDWPAEASTEWGSEGEKGLVQRRRGRKGLVRFAILVPI